MDAVIGVDEGALGTGLERPYGIDSSFRDPSGNHIRLTQVKELALP